MYHRKLHKYQEYEGMGNIVVGQAELVRIYTAHGIGWRTPSNTVIHDKQEALQYATALDSLIRYNKIRIATERNKLKS